MASIESGREVLEEVSNELPKTNTNVPLELQDLLHKIYRSMEEEGTCWDVTLKHRHQRNMEVNAPLKQTISDVVSAKYD